MRTIETTLRVAADGTGTLQVPGDIAPGEHRVVVVLDDGGRENAARPPLRFSAYPVGLAIDTTFSREELYDGGGP